MRSALTAGWLAVLLLACGGGEASLNEYTETLQARAFELGERLGAGDFLVTETPTIETVREVLTEALDLRVEFQEDLNSLRPPDEVADIHADMVDLHARIIAAQEALAAKAKTANALEELDQSEQAQAYRAIQTESTSLCRELQARIDVAAALPTFGMEAWVPGNLKEAVDLTFGC
jgi:hypothetical protein